MKMVGGKLVRSGIDVYLVMEHCGGGDLHELRGQLTASQIRSLMHQLLTAVEYMHGLNVWHRDLKSANVLLTVQEGRHIAKIADLGVLFHYADDVDIWPSNRGQGCWCSARGYVLDVTSPLCEQFEQTDRTGGVSMHRAVSLV